MNGVITVKGWHTAAFGSVIRNSNKNIMNNEQ